MAKNALTITELGEAVTNIEIAISWLVCGGAGGDSSHA